MPRKRAQGSSGEVVVHKRPGREIKEAAHRDKDDIRWESFDSRTNYACNHMLTRHHIEMTPDIREE